MIETKAQTPKNLVYFHLCQNKKQALLTQYFRGVFRRALPAGDGKMYTVPGITVKGGLLSCRSHIKKGRCQLTDVFHQFVIVSPGSEWFDFCHA